MRAAWIAYLVSSLIVAIRGTVFIEQDAAHYCHVATRIAAGDGATSLADRRGPVPDAGFPLPADGRTAWPYVLSAGPLLGVSPRSFGTWISCLGLLGSIAVGAWLAVRRLGAPSWAALLCVGSCLSHAQALRVAGLPLSDSASLLANLTFLVTITGSVRGPRSYLAVAVASAVAVGLRFQNVVLLLPLIWWWRRSVPRRFGGADPGTRDGLFGDRWVMVGIVGLLGIAVWNASGRLGESVWTGFDGIAVALDPTQRDSLPRALRFAAPLGLLGLWTLRHRAIATPFFLVGLAHFAALLAFPDPSDGRPWMFANRQGLPYHFVAGAFGAAWLASCRYPLANAGRQRTVGLWLRGLAVVLTAALVIDTVKRPYKLARSRPKSTARPELALALEQLRPVAVDADRAVVFAHDADVLSLELGLRTIHTRSFQPDPARPTNGPQTGPGASVTLGPTAQLLRRRGVTHVQLQFLESRALAGRNTQMEAFLRGFVGAPDAPGPMRVLDDRGAPDLGARSVLLVWR